MTLKSFIWVSIVFMKVTCMYSYFNGSTNGTEAYFWSPTSLSREVEVSRVLPLIQKQIEIDKTTYQTGGAVYVIDNFTVSLDYNQAHQKIEIQERQTVAVSGGKIIFDYNFNWSKTADGVKTIGYGYGYAMSDSLDYTKKLTYGEQGEVQWKLIQFFNLLMGDKLKIKRITPFKEQDFSNLEEMMDSAVKHIEPIYVKSQLLNKFNPLFRQLLDLELNHEVFGQKIKYSYPSSSKGALNMTIKHSVYDFDITPEDGYKVIFLTEIEDGGQSICNITVPQQHLKFQFFGGSQNIHLNCLYESVLQFMQKRGWLNTQLNTHWDVAAFQFYAGDLYDFINNLYLKVSPRSLLTGSCSARRDGLKLTFAGTLNPNTYLIEIDYDCLLRSTSKEGSQIDVLKFVAKVRFYIVVAAGKITLNFQIYEAQVSQLTFIPVSDFYVQDSKLGLAHFKVNQLIKSMEHTMTFGSGFPTLPRSVPSTKVNSEWVVYSDKSHMQMP